MAPALLHIQLHGIANLEGRRGIEVLGTKAPWIDPATSQHAACAVMPALTYAFAMAFVVVHQAQASARRLVNFSLLS